MLDEVKQKVQIYKELKEYLTELAHKYIEITHNTPIDISSINIDFEKNSIEVCGDEVAFHCLSCREEHYHSIPLEYTWDEKWEEKEKARMNEILKKRKERETLEEERRKKQIEKDELKTYKRLKKKYEIKNKLGE